MVLTAACLVPAAVAPVVAGLAQGLERFVLFAATQSGGPILRILWLVPAIAVGASVSGAVSATFVASLLMLLVPMCILAGWLRRGSEQRLVGTLRQFAGDLLPAFVGILAFTSLTTFDVIVAKLAFSDHDAGIYSAASASDG